MLLELHIQNFILIEDIHLSFSPGLSVITGETGAGKSILLEGIRIALGAPASKDNLRHSGEKGGFEVLLEDEEEVISVLREVFPSGKSLSRLQGLVTTLPQIRSTIAPMLDIYAQREDSLLLHPSSQRDVIDRFASEKIIGLLEEVARCREEDERIQIQLEEWKKRSQADLRDLTFERDELKSLHLDPVADALIEKEFSELKSLEDVLQLLSQAIDASSPEALADLERVLEKLGDGFEEARGRVESLRLELEDIEMFLHARMRALQEIPARAAQIEERYSLLFAVKRKYRRDLDELHGRLIELEALLAEHTSIKEKIGFLEAEKEENYQKYLCLSKELTILRKESFEHLREQMLPLLARIQLQGAKIDITFIPREDGKIHLKGDENLELIASVNEGSLKPLAQVLSGGELSRFMLALKAVFGRDDSTKTMIFDEIDAGVSGKTAFEVGRLLRDLSNQKQIIVITHQPQIVSFADHHFHIEKEQNRTQVKALSAAEHLERLALMLSPERTETAVLHAKQMIRQAKEET